MLFVKENEEAKEVNTIEEAISLFSEEGDEISNFLSSIYFCQYGSKGVLMNLMDFCRFIGNMELAIIKYNKTEEITFEEFKKELIKNLEECVRKPDKEKVLYIAM